MCCSCCYLPAVIWLLTLTQVIILPVYVHPEQRLPALLALFESLQQQQPLSISSIRTLTQEKKHDNHPLPQHWDQWLAFSHPHIVYIIRYLTKRQPQARQETRRAQK